MGLGPRVSDQQGRQGSPNRTSRTRLLACYGVYGHVASGRPPSACAASPDDGPSPAPPSEHPNGHPSRRLTISIPSSVDEDALACLGRFCGEHPTDGPSVSLVQVRQFIHNSYGVTEHDRRYRLPIWVVLMFKQWRRQCDCQFWIPSQYPLLKMALHLYKMK